MQPVEPATVELTQLTDEALLIHIARRDAHALAALYDRHAQAIYSLIMRIVREPASADEVLQDTFWQAWQKASDFQAGNAAAWLYRIARNKSLDWLRRQKARPQPVLSIDEPGVQVTSTAAHAHVEQLIVRTWQQEHLHQVLASLPPEQRQCLELAYFEGMSQRQIAEQMHTPLSTVKTRIQMALDKLGRTLRVGRLSVRGGRIMNAELHHSRVRELLPLYVVGALEPDELLAVEEYLQHHRDLLIELEELEAVIVQLAQNVPPAPLPDDGRNRLLARVQADLNNQPDHAPRRNAQPVTHQPEFEHKPASFVPGGYWHPLRRPQSANSHSRPTITPVKRRPIRPHTPPPGQRGGWFLRQGWAAAALCFVLACAALGLNLFQQSRVNLLSTEVARLSGEITGLNRTNEVLRQQLQESQNQMAIFIDAERSVAMAGTALAPAASGAFYLDGARGVVVVNGLEPLPSDRTYQLWLVPPGGTPTSIALLSAPVGGSTTQTVVVPPELRNFAIVDVSIEQAGGSAQITKETIVLRGVLN